VQKLGGTLAIESAPVPNSDENEVLLALIKARILTEKDIQEAAPNGTTIAGIPGLQDIPYVGRLFKR
jgi:hypothetical protein